MEDPNTTFFLINEEIQLVEDKPYQEVHIANIVGEDEDNYTYSYTESNLIYITRLARNGEYCTISKPLPIHSRVVYVKLPKSQAPQRAFKLYQDALGAIKNQLRKALDFEHESIDLLRSKLSQTTSASL